MKKGFKKVNYEVSLRCSQHVKMWWTSAQKRWYLISVSDPLSRTA